MAESAYFGVYCRRWGIALLDGGSVRLDASGWAGTGDGNHFDGAQGPGG